MKYKLIASDIDGTLVNSASQLTRRTKNAIIRAVDAGVIFVAATGRPFCNISIVNDLFDKDMPFIVFNGSAAYMGKSKKLLFEKFLDFSLAVEAFELGQKYDLPQIVWAGPSLWANRECNETLRYRDFSTIDKMSVTDDLYTIKDKIPGVSKVLWISDPAVIADKQREMSVLFEGRLNCYSSLPHFLEFVSIDASKGAALAEIGRLLGIDKSEMIAFGDAYNDLSMLGYAGFSVAMGNAPDDIKAVCSHIAPSNDDDGVASVIEDIILQSVYPEPNR